MAIFSSARPSASARAVAVNAYRALLSVVGRSGGNLGSTVELTAREADAILRLPAALWEQKDPSKLHETGRDALASDAVAIRQAWLAGMRWDRGGVATEPMGDTVGAPESVRLLRSGSVMAVVTRVEVGLVAEALHRGLDASVFPRLRRAVEPQSISEAADRVAEVLDRLAGPIVRRFGYGDYVPFPERVPSPPLENWVRFRASLNPLFELTIGIAAAARRSLSLVPPLLGDIIEATEAAARAMRPVEEYVDWLAHEHDWRMEARVGRASACLSVVTWVRFDLLGDDAWSDRVPSEISLTEEANPFGEIVNRFLSLDFEEVDDFRLRVREEGREIGRMLSLNEPVQGRPRREEDAGADPVDRAEEDVTKSNNPRAHPREVIKAPEFPLMGWKEIFEALGRLDVYDDTVKRRTFTNRLKDGNKQLGGPIKFEVPPGGSRARAIVKRSELLSFVQRIESLPQQADAANSDVRALRKALSDHEPHADDHRLSTSKTKSQSTRWRSSKR